MTSFVYFLAKLILYSDVLICGDLNTGLGELDDFYEPVYEDSDGDLSRIFPMSPNSARDIRNLLNKRNC